MKRGIQSSLMATVLLVAGSVAISQAATVEPLAAEAGGGAGGGQFWCGADCPGGWKNVFTCKDGESCCGWVYCDSLTGIFGCCSAGTTCQRTTNPYNYNCVVN